MSMVGQKYFKEGKHTFGGRQKYAKYNKINKISKNFRGKIAARGGLHSLSPPP